MATETDTVKPPPGPAPGPEINIGDLGSKGIRTRMPNSLVDAVNKVAGSRSEPSEGDEPPSDTPPVEKTPPEAKEKQQTPPPKPEAKVEPPKKEEPKKKDGIAEVREALDRANKRADEIQNSLTATAAEKAAAFTRQAELEAKLNEITKKVQEDYEPRVKRLEEVEKRVQAQEELIRVKDYTATEEFHNKYVKPISDVSSEAEELLREMVVADESGQTRQATKEDFNEILGARSINEASTIAVAKFGATVAPQVINLRQRLRSLNRIREEAVKNAAVESAEFVKRQQASQAQMRQATHERLLAETNRLMQAEPDIFNPPEEEVELRNSLVEGQQFADRLLNGDPNMTHEQFVAEIAKGRTRIMKSFVQDKKIKALTEKVASLEGQLKEYQKSEPAVETRNGGQIAPPSGARDKLLKAAQDLASQPR